MASRAGDWLAQSGRDLAQARLSLDGGQYEWACFAAQQTAEKALKALFQSLGGEVRGHVIRELLEALPEALAVPAELVEVAQRLDKHYTQPRYPNNFAAGYPGQHYSKSDAEQAIADAVAIADFCKRRMVRPEEGPPKAP